MGRAYTALMVRIQIRIPQDEHDAAKREAERLGISLAEFVRRAVRSALPAESSRPWMHYAGMVESGDPPQAAISSTSLAGEARACSCFAAPISS
jgi:hypothetical protein